MKQPFDSQNEKLYTLCILVDDAPGVLSQVARLFSRKGYNIKSIVSGATDRPNMTRISIEIWANKQMIGQISRQCRKILAVHAVKILDEDSCIRREIAVIKLQADSEEKRDKILHIVGMVNAKIMDADRDIMTVWFFGSPKENETLIAMLQDIGVLEIARTGTIAIETGKHTIYDSEDNENLN